MWKRPVDSKAPDVYNGRISIRHQPSFITIGAAICIAGWSTIALSEPAAVYRLIGGAEATSANARDFFRKSVAQQHLDADSAKGAVDNLSLTYQRNINAAEFQRTGVRLANSVRDLGFMFAGPVGIASSALFHASLDQMEEHYLDERTKADRTLFSIGLSTLTDDQFAQLLASKPDNAAAAGAFADYTKGLISQLAGDKLDESGKQRVANELVGIAARASVEDITLLRQQGQAITKIQDTLDGAVTSIRSMNAAVSNLVEQGRAHEAEMKAFIHEYEAKEEVAFENMSDSQKVRFIELGGLSYKTEQERSALHEAAKRGYERQRIYEEMGYASTTLGSLADFAMAVHADPTAFRQAQHSVDLVRAAYGAYMAFQTGTPAGIFTGVGLLGQLAGGLFGSGEDNPLADQLKQISDQLTDILNCERDILVRLDTVEVTLQDMQLQLKVMQQQLELSMSVVVYGQYPGLADCRANVLEQTAIDIPGPPFANVYDFERIHYLSASTYNVLMAPAEAMQYDGQAIVRTVGQACFDGLTHVLDHPDAIALIRPTPGQSSWSARYVDRRAVFDTFLTELVARTSPIPVGSFAPRLASPEVTIRDLAADGSTVVGAAAVSSMDSKIPCYWLTAGQLSGNKDRCGWMSGAHDEVTLEFQRYYDPLTVLGLADLSLAFYVVPLVPPRALWNDLTSSGEPPAPGGAPTSVDQRLDAAESRFISFVSQNGGDQGEARLTQAKKLLDKAIALVDESLAQQALLDGALLSRYLGQELLSAATVPPSNKCTDPALLGAATTSLLQDNPLLARNSVLFALSRRALPAPVTPSSGEAGASVWSNSSESLRLYGWLWSHAPESPNQLWENHPAEYLWSRDNDYWKPLYGGTQLHFIYGRSEGEQRAWKHLVRDASPTVQSQSDCRGYSIEDDSKVVEVPKGWSVVIGGRVIPMPSPSELIEGRLSRSPEVVALLERRDALLNERATFLETSISDRQHLLLRAGAVDRAALLQRQ